MSFVSQVLGGSMATKSIKNVFATAGFAPQAINNQSGAIVVNSGALTANTLAVIFSATGGPIEMSQLSIRSADTTTRTLRVVVEIDGNTSPAAFDYTSTAFGANNTGLCLAGNYNIGSNQFLQSPIRSTSSIVIKVASNLTETDKFIIEYVYQEIV